MKKLFAITASTLATASAAVAGSVTYIPPEVTMIEEPMAMGGSGAWMIPLIILAILGLALTINQG